MLLDRDEYIEQAYFFRILEERQTQNVAIQEMLASVKEEILASTKLPMAIDFLASELKMHGILSSAMERLGHYFTPFQTFVLGEAERDSGKFDFQVAMKILHHQALYMSENPSAAGLFMYEFEAICRNRLGYDRGLEAISRDPFFDNDWREWILLVRRQVGLVDLSDLLFIRSEHYFQLRQRRGEELPTEPILFGEKEGKIALANRRKDPLFLFSALQRHLNYPMVPRPARVDETEQVIPNLLRRVERLESQVKILDEEQRGGIDLSKFYLPPEGEISEE